MAGLLDFFTGGGEYADPNAIDERYGVSKGDVRQAALNTLGNVSGLLLAAGQPMSGSQRAQLLGQLGPAFGGAQTDIYNAAQRRLLGAENEQKMAQMQQMKALADEMKDPAAFAAKYGFNPSGLPPQAVSEIIMGQRKAKALETPADVRMREILSGGGNVSPTEALTAGGGPTVDNAAAIGQPQDAAALAQRYIAAGNVAMQAGRIEDANKLFDAAKKITPEAAKPRERETIGGILYERDPATGGWVKAIEPDKAAEIASKAFAAAEPLRKEFFALPAVKTFTESQRNLNVITDIRDRANSGEAGIGTGVNDITLVYNFFKTLDPTSVVRESEFATVGQKMGLPSQITAAFQSVSGGGFLPPEIRDELVKIASQFVTAQYQDVARASDIYSGYATKMGIDPNLVVADFRSATPTVAPSTTPTIPSEAGAGGANLVDQIKATTDARTLLDLGTNYETWDNATKAAYVARLNQISAGVR